MISFEIPEKVENQVAMVKMLAEQAMRPYSRYYDEHEHELPAQFVNMMWPFAKERNKRDYEKTVQQNGHSNGKPEGPNLGLLQLILTIEMLSWGDAGQYLSSPTPALGGYGYIREYPVELWLRNARGFATFDGLCIY